MAGTTQHPILERTSPARASPAPLERPLFRPEVFASRRHRHFGHVLDHHPLPLWWLLGPTLGVAILYLWLTAAISHGDHEVMTAMNSHPRPARSIPDP